jgi:hypothetical protein
MLNLQRLCRTVLPEIGASRPFPLLLLLLFVLDLPSILFFVVQNIQVWRAGGAIKLFVVQNIQNLVEKGVQQNYLLCKIFNNLPKRG